MIFKNFSIVMEKNLLQNTISCRKKLRSQEVTISDFVRKINPDPPAVTMAT